MGFETGRNVLKDFGSLAEISGYPLGGNKANFRGMVNEKDQLRVFAKPVFFCQNQPVRDRYSHKSGKKEKKTGCWERKQETFFCPLHILHSKGNVLMGRHSSFSKLAAF